MHRLLQVGMLILAMAATTARAQSAPDPLDILIKQLAAEDFAARDLAADEIQASSDATLARLEQKLRDPSLSTEQRYRLSGLARDRFYNTDRAAMGVQFDRVLTDRVVLDQAYEPFPAAKILQPGDMIIEAAGQSIRGRNANNILRAIIFSRDPGDVVPLVVRRGAEKLTLEIPLGRFSDLRQAMMSDMDLARAWETRLQRFAPAAPPMLETPELTSVGADAWAPRGDQRSRILNQKMINAGMAGSPGVFGGAEARGSRVGYEDPQQAILRRAFLFQNGGIDPRNLPPGIFRRQEPVNVPTLKIYQELEILRSNLAKYRQERNELDQPGPREDPAPGETEEEIADAVDKLKEGRDRTIARLEKQVAALEAELADHPEEAAPAEGPIGPQKPEQLNLD